MGLRETLRRLKREASQDLASFELTDGTSYYFDELEECKAVFMHCMDCIDAGNPPDWPAPPEILHKLTEARDVAAALRSLAEFEQFLPYDAGILVTERRLEPRSLAAGRDPYDQATPDLSEL